MSQKSGTSQVRKEMHRVSAALEQCLSAAAVPPVPCACACPFVPSRLTRTYLHAGWSEGLPLRAQPGRHQLRRLPQVLDVPLLRPGPFPMLGSRRRRASGAFTVHSPGWSFRAERDSYGCHLHTKWRKGRSSVLELPPLSSFVTGTSFQNT